MQVVTMKFNHTKYLGNNSSSSLTVEATLSETDNVQESFKTLESFVLSNLNNKPVSTQVAEALENYKPSESTKAEPTKEETQQPKEVKNGNSKENASEESSSETSSEETSKESSSEEKVVKPKKEKAPKAPPKPKTVAYDRNNNNHKMDFSQLLDGLFKGWKADKILVDRAKLISAQMEGKEMYSPEGKIIDTFIEALKSGMTSESPIKA